MARWARLSFRSRFLICGAAAEGESGCPEHPASIATRRRPGWAWRAGGRGGGRGGPRCPAAPGFTSQRGGGGPQWSDANSLNPLLRGGQEIVQSLSHIVLTWPADVLLLRGLRRRVGSRRVAARPHEPWLLSRASEGLRDAARRSGASVDDVDRKAVVFQLQVPSSGLKPGLYTCQINVIDEVSGRFAFPRLAVYLKEASPAAEALRPAERPAPAAP